MRWSIIHPVALTVLLLMPLALYAQGSLQVSGTVIDAQTRKPMPQATVKAEGTSVTTVTNDDGVFLLKLPDDISTVSVSHMGYKTFHVNLRDAGDVRHLTIPPTESLEHAIGHLTKSR